MYVITSKALKSVPTSYLYDSSLPLVQTSSTTMDGSALGDEPGAQKARGLRSAEVNEIKNAAGKLHRGILELVKNRAITSEEARIDLSAVKDLLTEADRLGRSQKVSRPQAKDLRRKGVELLQNARKYKNYLDDRHKNAVKGRSTKGLKLISNFNINPPVIRVHEKEAIHISFIVSEDVSSIACYILSSERQGEPPPASRFFEIDSTPGYHYVIWDGTFGNPDEPPRNAETYRVRIMVGDKHGRKEEIFDQIQVLNPRNETVLPRIGSALHSLRFDGKHAVLTDTKGNAIRVRAVSGLKPNHRLNPKKTDFTKPESQWEEDKGPLPESKYVPGGKYIIRKHSVQRPVLKDGVLRYPSGDRRGSTVAVWGSARVPLHPSIVTKGSNVRQGCCTRSEFFVHIDTKNDGTAGCIGVHPDDEGKFNQMMSVIALMPNDELPVIVEYKQ